MVAARLLLRRWCVVGVLHHPVVLDGRVTYVTVGSNLSPLAVCDAKPI